jgi:hypothetical protein
MGGERLSEVSMSASISTPAAVNRQRPSASEWLALRRHPIPEFWNSLDKLPPSLAVPAQAALLPRDEVLGAIVAPAEYLARRMVHWEYVPERALILLNDAVLHIVAGDSDEPARMERIDASALLYVRSSVILLYGLLEFQADCGANAGSARLEYNTVIWEALNKPLLSLISAACPAPARGEVADARAANEQLLRTLPFKFANGLRYHSLSPGEQVLAAAFQPAIWRKGRLPIRRQVAPNALLARTDRKLVLIEETRAQSWWRPAAGQTEYGWIFTYIPLDRVIDISVAPNEEYSELTILLEWGAARETRSLLLEPSVAETWLEVWAGEPG